MAASSSRSETIPPRDYDASKRKLQLEALPSSLANVSKVLTPAAFPFGHARLSEFMHWLIRNDYLQQYFPDVEGNTDIGVLVAGIFFHLWSINRPELQVLANHMQVASSTISSIGPHFWPFYRLFRRQHSVTVFYNEKVEVLSWDREDLTDSMYTFDELSDRIQARFSLKYPQHCYSVTERISGAATSSFANYKWKACHSYTVTENKEEVKQFKKQRSSRANKTELRQYSVASSSTGPDESAPLLKKH